MAFDKIQSIAKLVDLQDVQKVFLPTSIRKYTVLRSPHIDKKSREQFEMRTYKRVFQLQTEKPARARFYLQLLKNMHFHGVEIEIVISYPSRLPSS